MFCKCFAGHKNWVLCVAWSPDGKHLVSGSKAGEIIMWDPKSGKASGNPFTVSWFTSISMDVIFLVVYCSIF